MRCGVWVVYRCQTPTTISWEDDLELNATGADGVGAAGALEGPGGGVATGAGETDATRRLGAIVNCARGTMVEAGKPDFS
jgi:hypothetical protein